MSDGYINLLLAVAGLLAVILILALPEDWTARLLRRRQARPLTPPTPDGREHRLVCAECGSLSPPRAPGWQAHLTPEHETIFYCPVCVARARSRAGD